MKTLTDYKNYVYIKAWGLYMQSLPNYIRDQQHIAARDNVPLNAVYFSYDEKRWVLFNEIKSEEVKYRVSKIYQILLERRERG